MSGALLERVRLSAYLVLAVLLGSAVWILDAAWGWSFGGWLTLRFGFHDSIASAVVHGVSGAFTLGVLFNLGPRIGKYTKEGLTRTFRPHNIHMTLMGLMLIFTGFYAFYAACLVIVSTTVPGWANIYLSPTTLGSIAMIITFGFAGGFTGGYFASRGDPFWTVSGGLAGVISVSAGADVYAPTLGYLIAALSAALAVWVGNWIETKMRVDDVVGAVAVHGFAGFLGILWVGVFAAGYPTGRQQRRELDRRPADGPGDLPAARLPLRLVRVMVLKKLNLLRVPPEVEVDGLDNAEYEYDIHVPEYAHAEDLVIEPDGARVPADRVQAEAARELVTVAEPRAPTRARVTDAAIIDSAPDCVSKDPGTEEARVEDSADFVIGDPYTECAGFMTFGPGSTYGEEGWAPRAPTWS